MVSQQPLLQRYPLANEQSSPVEYSLPVWIPMFEMHRLESVHVHPHRYAMHHKFGLVQHK